MTTYIYKLSVFLFLLIMLGSCSKEDTEIKGGRIPLELSVGIQTQTKSNVKGDSFVEGDSFVLYKDAIVTTNTSSVYTLDEEVWQGVPGLFWDDMELAVAIPFTGIMDNGGTLNLESSPAFAVQANQNSNENYIKSDLLVAYGIAKYTDSDMRKLKLRFKHVFAHLVFAIKEKDGYDPSILSSNTVVKLSGTKNNSTLGFTLATLGGDGKIVDGVTGVTASGSVQDITLRKVSVKDNVYTYEAILPAQDLSNNVSITISNNTNDKTYTYDLSAVSIAGEGFTDKTDLLKQGHTTTLNLKIAKTAVTVNANITKWTEKSASGVATPDDYPIIEIGGEDGPGDGEGIGDGDDYAGKTIRLNGDITGEDLNKIIKLPIGSKDRPFRGTFDGQGYTIKDISLDMDTAFLGVFGYTDGATIHDLNVEGKTGGVINNRNKSANTATGGLAGYVNNTRVENCHVYYDNSGGVSAVDNVGGLIGYVNGLSTIINSSAHTPVNSSHDYAGGLIGRSEDGMTLSYSYAEGDVEIVGTYVGGLIGYTRSGTITFCYTWGSAKGKRYVGGFIGQSDKTTIRNSYAAGKEVSDGTSVAAFIGSATGVKVKNCYWNVALADGLGSNDAEFDSSNSSFTLVANEDAMQTVLNGLNQESVEELGEWKLEAGYDDYILPKLLKNNGRAIHEDE